MINGLFEHRLPGHGGRRAGLPRDELEVVEIDEAVYERLKGACLIPQQSLTDRGLLWRWRRAMSTSCSSAWS
jgi:hypothetical protein